jgi:hypothetical protein
LYFCVCENEAPLSTKVGLLLICMLAKVEPLVSFGVVSVFFVKIEPLVFFGILFLFKIFWLRFPVKAQPLTRFLGFCFFFEKKLASLFCKG